MAQRLHRRVGVFPELHLVVGTTRLDVSLHGLAILVGVAAGGALAARRAREPALALLAVAAVAVVALLASHALFVVRTSGDPVGWSGGLASSGGVAAALLATWALARLAGRSPAELLDALAPAGLLALGIGRIGCFLAGCCFGRPTTLPWGVVLPDLGAPPRHPLQLYSAAADLALVALLPAAPRPPGTLARRACAGFGLVRAALECLRDPAATDVVARGWLTLPQVAALALVAGALVASPLRLRRASTMPPARRTPQHGR